MNTEDIRAVTAVVVNYGAADDTTALLDNIESIVNNILVVDNSGDLPPTHGAFANARIINPGRNLGYGAAVNLAAAQTGTRWLLVLNPDVRLPGDAIEQLLHAAVTLKAPLCGPRFYWDDARTFQLPPAQGHPLWLLSDRHTPGRNPTAAPDLGALSLVRHKRFWAESAPFSEPVLSGACLLFDLHWFRQNQMPLFDESFFLYYEDADLCARLMHKGVMPVCVPEAEVVHYWNQSSEPPQGKAALMQESERVFLNRYFPDGAPPLPPSGIPADKPSTLGLLREPPALILPEQAVLVDVGVQPDFLMFARCLAGKPTFSFTQAMWRRMRDGRYYLRAGNQAGDFIQYWVFDKSTETGSKA